MWARERIGWQITENFNYFIKANYNLPSLTDKTTELVVRFHCLEDVHRNSVKADFAPKCARVQCAKPAMDGREKVSHGIVALGHS